MIATGQPLAVSRFQSFGQTTTADGSYQRLWPRLIERSQALEARSHHSALDEVAQQVTKGWREPVIEARASDGLIGYCRVRALEAGNSAGFAANGESHDERPDEHRNVDCPDNITLEHDVFDTLCWKGGNQPLSNKIWGEFGVYILPPRSLQR